MSTGTERSKPPLHNFTMPCDLRWGNQRFLRCMKVNNNNNSSDHHRRTTARIEREKNPYPNGSSIRVGPPAESNGIAAVREKVMLDLQTAADKMKNAIFKDGVEKGEVLEAEGDRPWNLRTRRAAVTNVKVDLWRPSPEMAEKIERAKFSVALSKREIEEDFMGVVGHRPPRRPKKRAKIIQKQLDTLFPGLWLTEVTSDMYKVHEAAP
ncbi:hypothetical protein ACJIZ3_020122 [Penstemon smallii]|uniref:Uncharacterized protein n=1 Tax=Penstemon smallii TaxID=265156 RepID=A0ABD3SHX1_9LAMI